MNLFLCRHQYTNNPKQWPVIPFSLELQDNHILHEFETDYRIGLQKPLILGWVLGINESLHSSGIACSISVWTKRIFDSDWDIGQIDVKRFYDNVSPVLSKVRHYSEDFNNIMLRKDSYIAKSIFEFLEEETRNVDSGLRISIDNSNDIIINVKSFEDRVYFMYKCPYLNFTELVFPIMCESTTIGLVSVYQIIEDLHENINSINSLDDFNFIDFDFASLKSCDINVVISTVFKSINDIEKLYQQQVDLERKRIMNSVLDIITEEQRKFSLYRYHTMSGNAYPLISDENDIKQAAHTFLVNNLSIIERGFGLERISLYLDDNLEPEVNINGFFYTQWMATERGNRNKIYSVINGEDGVGDLFKITNKSSQKENTMMDNFYPCDPSWSVVMFENSSYKDETGRNKELPPLIVGIKYKGGATGKGKYYRNQERDWVNYVLEKFIIFTQNLLLTVAAHKQAEAIEESRITLEHESGQIYAAIQGLNMTFRMRCESLKNKAQRAVTNDEFKQELFSFIEKSMLYSGDINGLFTRIKMLSVVYDDKPVANPKYFDVAKAFLSKWEYAFTSMCRAENKWAKIYYPPINRSLERRMYTDPGFLEHAVYNIVSNAIKYAYINTRIYIEFVKKTDYHEITVTDYGSYLDVSDYSIYHRGVRGVHRKSLRNIDDVTAISEFKNIRTVEGKGIGLYLSKKLVEVLQGNIIHTCEEISRYNVSLMWTFLDSYEHDTKFKEMWDVHSKPSDELFYDTIQSEFMNLKEAGIIDQIVNDYDYGILKKIPALALYDQLQERTHKVSFTIKIPSYKDV
ncbi:MAG: ATP-binding protein [Defluviitaleaceae bacterium]|nr:ATP-binding protein [Defluviitaleaceae bacterium]